MSYAILRTTKLKSLASILGSGKHTFREVKAPNSNGAKNLWLTGPTNSSALVKAVQARLPVKRRKSSVLCIEYLITASPEAFARHGGTMPDTGGYFDQAMAWLKARHGAANIVCAEVHLDERTPHLVAYVTPLTKDGRLSARDFLGGPAKLRKMQTDFHHWCGKPFGLSRGIEGTKAPHQKVGQYYQALATPEPVIARADLAAAAAGIYTRSYTALLDRIKAATTLLKLQAKAMVAIRDRQDALGRRQVQLKQSQRKLEDREIALERQADRLNEVDRALEFALFKADFERARADELELKLNNATKKSPSLNIESVRPTQHRT